MRLRAGQFYVERRTFESPNLGRPSPVPDVDLPPKYALVLPRVPTVAYAGAGDAMKKVWLRSAIILSGVLAYRVACDLLDRQLTDAYICGALTIIGGVIVALTEL